MMDKGDYVEKERELKRERKFLRNVMVTIPDFTLILDRELWIKVTAAIPRHLEELVEEPTAKLRLSNGQLRLVAGD